MPEWLIGFGSGIIGAIIGFALAMVWDVFKSKRQSKQKAKTIWSAVQLDLMDNRLIIQSNITLLEGELKHIDQRKIVGDALVPLRTGFEELLKVNLPFRELKIELHIPLNMIAIAQLAREINEAIRSRESYRIHNQAMPNYFSILKFLDERLIQSHKKLLELLEKVVPLDPATEQFAKEIVNSIVEEIKREA
ncbi:hypothetical protein M1N59_01600 [Dehalococcoidales bacterium]|nr:hypothetical protein [Dehalococcoidales bacterium]